MKLDDLLGEYYELEQQLADPAVHADQAQARTLAKRYSQLTPIVATYRELNRVESDIETAQELAAEDPSFADEAKQLAAQREELVQRLRTLLIPRDPNDDKDVILEVKAGEGGEESALFASDLVRMYLRYAERQGWKTEIISATHSDLGGYKDITIAIKNRGTVEPGQGVWHRLKFEGGVHRVQRVPVTESQGRIHTSAVGVLVLPEAEEIEVEINESDLRIDVYRSSGPGGQSVNTTDSAVRLTHYETGIVVVCQDEKSQHKNYAKALRVLRAKLFELELEKQRAERDATRQSMVGSGERSEKIRTYNFPQDRLTDHRLNLTRHNLDAILDGDIHDLLIACRNHFMAQELEAQEQASP